MATLPANPKLAYLTVAHLEEGLIIHAGRWFVEHLHRRHELYLGVRLGQFLPEGVGAVRHKCAQLLIAVPHWQRQKELQASPFQQLSLVFSLQNVELASIAVPYRYRGMT